MSLVEQLKPRYPYLIPGTFTLPKPFLEDGKIGEVKVIDCPGAIRVQGSITPAYEQVTGRSAIVRGEAVAGNFRYVSQETINDGIDEVAKLLSDYMQVPNNVHTPLGIALSQGKWENISSNDPSSEVYRQRGVSGLIEQLIIKNNGVHRSVSTSILLTTNLYAGETPRLFGQWSQVEPNKDLGYEVLRQIEGLRIFHT